MARLAEGPFSVQAAHHVDTFAALVPVPVPGYARQTGCFTLAADVTAYAGTGEQLTLACQLADVGDGRVNSAILVRGALRTSSCITTRSKAQHLRPRCS